MNKMVFLYESQAFFCNFSKGVGFPLDGIKLNANLAHKYKIPITWLTNAQGAELGADLFTEYHQQFGDEISLWIMPDEKYKKDQYRTVMKWNEQEVREFIENQMIRVKTALPWAKVESCGCFFRNNLVVKVLSEFKLFGAYGACWYQYNTDSVDDVGIPFGCYYMDPSNYKRPAQISGDEKNPLVISNPWLTHDLNKGFNYRHTDTAFSTDPNCVQSIGISYPNYNEYWQNLFAQHYFAAQNNLFYPFIFQQESHEMLHNSEFAIYPPKVIHEATWMTENLLAYICNPENQFQVDFLTVADALKRYRTLFSKTQAMISMFEDTEITSPRYVKMKEEILSRLPHRCKSEDWFANYQRSMEFKLTPFPTTLVYYDLDCQLFFHYPQSFPIEIRNYLRKEPVTKKNLSRNSNLFKMDKYPIPFYTPHPWASSSKMEIGFSSNFQSETEIIIPYGLLLWEPQRLFRGNFAPKWEKIKVAWKKINDTGENLDLDAYCNPKKIQSIIGQELNLETNNLTISSLRPYFSTIQSNHPNYYQSSMKDALLIRFNVNLAQISKQKIIFTL